MWTCSTIKSARCVRRHVMLQLCNAPALSTSGICAALWKCRMYVQEYVLSILYPLSSSFIFQGLSFTGFPSPLGATWFSYWKHLPSSERAHVWSDDTSAWWSQQQILIQLKGRLIVLAGYGTEKPQSTDLPPSLFILAENISGPLQMIGPSVMQTLSLNEFRRWLPTFYRSISIQPHSTAQLKEYSS